MVTAAALKELDDAIEVMVAERDALRTSNADLLATCKAQHEAIDILFAMLAARAPRGNPFFPSRSGKAWDAALAGNAAIKKAESTDG